jgi:O-antigen polymerase
VERLDTEFIHNEAAPLQPAGLDGQVSSPVATEQPCPSLRSRHLFSEALFFLMFALCLDVPNLVYSGTGFYQTLHFMKWVTALAPVGVMALCTGSAALLEGRNARMEVDALGVYWLGFFAFITLQPLWVDIHLANGWLREWFFYAGCMAFYFAAFASFREKWLRAVLWLATLNAAVTGIFAELQVRGITSPILGMKLIMPTPGHYIGNTGQQNMFGIWMALALFSSLFLFVCYGGRYSKNFANKLLISGNAVFYVILSWCLICSTSRSAILAFWVGAFFLALMTHLTDRDRARQKRLAAGIVLFFIVLAVFLILDQTRGLDFLRKTRDMLRNLADVGARREIWKSSWQVFLVHPFTGVGLGQFKWHYLEGQHLAMALDPSMKWQFTYWAHNEILQWFCEFGLWGGLSLFFVMAFWLVAFVIYVRKHRGRMLPTEFLWGAALLFLIWFDALWTRPFHRIENTLWIVLAFALSSRHLFSGKDAAFTPRKFSPFLHHLTGALLVAGATAGFWFGIDGFRADRLLRQAVSYTADLARRKEMIATASFSPMLGDHARREMALLVLEQGKKANDGDLIADGLNRLIAVFRQKPTGEDYLTLLKNARQYSVAPLLEFLKPYGAPEQNRRSAESSASLKVSGTKKL